MFFSFIKKMFPLRLGVFALDVVLQLTKQLF